MYVLVWARVVSGGEWVLVALGVVLDIVSYGARAAKGRTSYY